MLKSSSETYCVMFKLVSLTQLKAPWQCTWKLFCVAGSLLKLEVAESFIQWKAKAFPLYKNKQNPLAITEVFWDEKAFYSPSDPRDSTGIFSLIEWNVSNILFFQGKYFNYFPNILYDPFSSSSSITHSYGSHTEESICMYLWVMAQTTIKHF